MRINPKLFTLSLVLATALTATSAVAATQTKSESRDDRGSNVIMRIIDAIKRHFVRTSADGAIIPPPA